MMAAMSTLGNCSTARPPVLPPPVPLERLGAHVPDARRMVSAWARQTGLRLQPCDREEIVDEALLRCAGALSHKSEVDEEEMTAVRTMNTRWALIDFIRAAARRGEREQLTAPEKITAMADTAAELDEDPVSAPLEQADAVTRLLGPLNERERELMLERYVLDLDVTEVAARHHMGVSAVKTTCFRAVRKARESAGGEGDVTDQGSAPVLQENPTYPQDDLPTAGVQRPEFPDLDRARGAAGPNSKRVSPRGHR
jgi:RNA polymerase sigma factor (sigma-70 family)